MKLLIPMVALIVLVAAVFLLRPSHDRNTNEDGPVSSDPVTYTVPDGPKPAGKPPAAADYEVPPELKDPKLVRVYREARETVVLNPRDAMKFAPIFLKDSPTWKGPMKHMAEKDPNPRVRAFALRMMMNYGDPSLETLFRERLVGDDGFGVRQNAAEALGKLPAISAESKEALRNAAASDENEGVRKMAQLSLAKHQ